MDTSWWVALGVVALLAFVAALVDGRGRLGPRRLGGTSQERPAPGEMWLARVPGRRREERLVLVLAARADGVARVARLTDEPPGPSAVPVVPPGAPDGPLYADPDGLAHLGPARLTRRTGEIEPTAWDDVRHLAE